MRRQDFRDLFADGTNGSIVFSEEGIAFIDCGELRYQWGTPGEAPRLSFEGNMMKGCHNGFSYAVEISAEVTPTTDGAVFAEKNGKIFVQMTN